MKHPSYVDTEYRIQFSHEHPQKYQSKPYYIYNIYIIYIVPLFYQFFIPSPNKLYSVFCIHLCRKFFLFYLWQFQYFAVSLHVNK